MQIGFIPAENDLPKGFESFFLRREQDSPRCLPWCFESFFFLRREQDSNLRTGFAGYTLSRRASSTTRAPLLDNCGCKGNKR